MSSGDTSAWALVDTVSGTTTSLVVAVYPDPPPSASFIQVRVRAMDSTNMISTHSDPSNGPVAGVSSGKRRPDGSLMSNDEGCHVDVMTHEDGVMRVGYRVPDGLSVRCRLYDVTGRVCAERTLRSGADSYIVDDVLTGFLSPGVYVARVEIGNGEVHDFKVLLR